MTLLKNIELIKLLGLNHLYVLDQIYSWINYNKKHNKNFKNGKFWTFSSIKDMQERDFPFLSVSTLRNILKHLEDLSFIIVSNFNNSKWNKTKWYTINYKKLNTYLENDNVSSCEKIENSITEKEETRINKNDKIENTKNTESEKDLNKIYNKKDINKITTTEIAVDTLTNLKEKFNFKWLLKAYKKDESIVIALFELLEEIFTTSCKELKTSNNSLNVKLLRERIQKFDITHIQYVIEAFMLTEKVYNIRAFLLNLLFNAELEIDNFYKNITLKELQCI